MKITIKDKLHLPLTDQRFPALRQRSSQLICCHYRWAINVSFYFHGRTFPHNHCRGIRAYWRTVRSPYLTSLHHWFCSSDRQTFACSIDGRRSFISCQPELGTGLAWLPATTTGWNTIRGLLDALCDIVYVLYIYICVLLRAPPLF